MFPEKLKELRNAKKISLDKMAEELNNQYNTNISKSMISRWEHGKTDPQMKYVRILADYFNVSSNEIMETKGDESNDSLRYSLLSIYDQLDSNRKNNVYNYATTQLDKQKNAYSSTLGENRHIVYLYGAVSAGTGEYIPQDESNPEKIIVEGKVPDHDFAVRVNGGSMEPLFTDQQIIYVNKADKSEVRNHQFVIAELNGEFFIKKLQIDGDGSVKLISLNKKYSDIQIHDYDDFVIRGIVII